MVDRQHQSADKALFPHDEIDAILGTPTGIPISQETTLSRRRNMASDDFRPKLGRIRARPGSKNQRYLNKVIKTMRQASQRPGNKSHSSFTGSRIGRGYSAGTVLTSQISQPGRRRVIIKARFTSFKRGGLGAARAHLRYIQRDGVTLEGEKGQLYGPDKDQMDGKTFLERSEGDPHQFRIIVAAEDGSEFRDLKPFIRSLMTQAERDLGTKLDWVAVDHFNTGHPHTHIVIRGKDDKGGDLIIARDYISRGLRERARDLATLELGPESADSIQKKLALEVDADRFTRLDRSILRDAEGGVLAITSKTGLDKRRHALRMGRLRKLESMGLADELKPGVWRIAERTQTTLRQLGERGDIIKTMQRVLKEAGIDRGAADYSVFDASKPNMKITGKIVVMGLSNELQDQHYVVVDGTDGKLHYAEIGRLSQFDPPARDMVVSLRGGVTQDRAQQSPKPQTRLFIESHVPFRDLVTAEGATWLDRKLLSPQLDTFREKGFGAETSQALRQRQRWLVQEGMMTEQDGRLIARRRMLDELTNREVSKAASSLAKATGMEHFAASELGRSGVQINRSVRLASGRFAVLQKGKQFALVPWQQAMRMRKGVGIGMEAGRGVSR
jgi:type IV secretory pathway VirD2 relaxase